MRLRIAALVLAVVVAGCTSPLGGGDGGDDDGPAIRGVVVEQAELEDSTVSTGGSTRVILRVHNTNPTPVTDFSAAVTNTGPMTAELDSGPCDGGTLSAAAAAATTRTCVWSIDASGLGADDAGTYPLQLRIEYNSTLRMIKNTPKFTFVSDVEDRSTVTQSYSNTELRMSVTHRPEHPTGVSTVEVDVDLADTGSGDVVPVSGTDVALSYSGSMIDAFREWGGEVSEEDGKRRCRQANFIAGSDTTAITCVLHSTSDSLSDGETLNLRIDADYGYRRYLELPLTVEE